MIGLARYLGVGESRGACSLQLRDSLRYRVKRIEFHSLASTLHGSLVQLMGLQIKASGFSGPARKDENAVIILGQAFEPRGRVHGVADRSDDLRTRRPHRADDCLAEMDGQPH